MVFGKKKKKAEEDIDLEELKKQKEEIEKKLQEAGEEEVEEEAPAPIKKTIKSTDGKRYVVKEFPTEYSKAIVDEKEEEAYDAFSVLAEILNKLEKLEQAIG